MRKRGKVRYTKYVMFNVKEISSVIILEAGTIIMCNL